MINVSSYPLCSRKLHFQRVDLADPQMTRYWAAVCVASDLIDEQLTDFGGFDFSDRSEANGKKLLSRLEAFLSARAQRYAKHSVQAGCDIKGLLGVYGVKTAELRNEDDFWTAAEALFPGHLVRNGGLTSLYVQIKNIPKKERKRLGCANLRNLRGDWVSGAASHQVKLQRAAA